MERNYRSLFINIFVGSNGIRAGWRLLLFVTFFRGVAAAMVFALKCIPSFRAWRLAQDPNVLTASYQIYRGATFVAALLLAIVLMSLIELRNAGLWIAISHPKKRSRNISGKALHQRVVVITTTILVRARSG
jgi:dipeptide/tripeptide permease